MIDLRQHLDPDWQPYADFAGLLGRVQRVRQAGVKGWRGACWRLVEPRFAREGDRLAGMGAKMFGGRWNPKGLAALYGSETRVVAVAEAYGTGNRYEVTRKQFRPGVLFAFEADLEAVLDLTDGEVRRRRQVSEERMLESDWLAQLTQRQEVLTQALSRAACLAGYEALRVPTHYSRSAANLVAFPEVAGVADRLATVSEEELDELG